jgi:hypothetical protein
MVHSRAPKPLWDYSLEKQSCDHALHLTFTAFKAKSQRLMSWEHYRDYEVIVSDDKLSSDLTLNPTSTRTWFTHELTNCRCANDI